MSDAASRLEARMTALANGALDDLFSIYRREVTAAIKEYAAALGYDVEVSEDHLHDLLEKVVGTLDERREMAIEKAMERMVANSGR